MYSTYEFNMAFEHILVWLYYFNSISQFLTENVIDESINMLREIYASSRFLLQPQKIVTAGYNVGLWM